jgi:hypothetical protein
VVDRDNLLCNIDELSPRRVRGWMWSRADPLVPPRLHVLIDGTEILAFAPDLPREDVMATGIGGLRVGFCFRIPPVWFDGRPHRLRICLDDGTNVAISQHGEVVPTCEFEELHTPEPLEGAFDGIKGVHADGWVLCEGAPTSLLMGGVEILITCDGRPVGQFIADQPRPDVGAILGNMTTPPLCGFSVYIPKVFRTRTERVFRVVTVAGGIELPGSPVIASFF